MECTLYFQELTDWANDVLKTKNLPLITDLRKSVGDGYTLPTILEIVSKYMYLSCLMRKPTICICENKDADQLRGNREADQRICFRYSSTF